VPLGTPGTLMLAPATGNDAITGPPGVTDARSRYEVGAPPPAPGVHEKFTVLPDTTGAFIVGAAGAAGAVTVSVTSFDGALAPPALMATRRT
jgi:hypothetical protein